MLGSCFKVHNILEVFGSIVSAKIHQYALSEWDEGMDGYPEESTSQRSILRNRSQSRECVLRIIEGREV